MKSWVTGQTMPIDDDVDDTTADADASEDDVKYDGHDVNDRAAAQSEKDVLTIRMIRRKKKIMMMTMMMMVM